MQGEDFRFVFRPVLAKGFVVLWEPGVFVNQAISTKVLCMSRSCKTQKEEKKSS